MLPISHSAVDGENAAEGGQNVIDHQHQRQPDFERLANLVVVSGEEAARAMAMRIEEQKASSPTPTSSTREMEDESPLSDYKCVICLGVFINACGIPCGHKFCRLCINKWLRARSKPLCPICRTDVRTSPDPLPTIDECVTSLYETLIEEERIERASCLKRRAEEEKAEMARIEQQLMGVADSELHTLQLYEALETVLLEPWALNQERQGARGYRRMLFDLADYGGTHDDDDIWGSGPTSGDSSISQESARTHPAGRGGSDHAANLNSAPISGIPSPIPILAFTVPVPVQYSSGANVQTVRDGPNTSVVRPRYEQERYMLQNSNFNGRACLGYPTYGLPPSGPRNPPNIRFFGGGTDGQVLSQPQDMNAQGDTLLRRQLPNWPGGNVGASQMCAAFPLRNDSSGNSARPNSCPFYYPGISPPPPSGTMHMQMMQPEMSTMCAQPYTLQHMPRPSNSAFTLPFPSQVQNFQSFVPAPVFYPTPRLNLSPPTYLNVAPPPFQTNIGGVQPVPIPVVHFRPAHRQGVNPVLAQPQAPARRSQPNSTWNFDGSAAQYTQGPQQWPQSHQQRQWSLDGSPQGLVPLPFGNNEYLHFNFRLGSSNPSSVTGISPVMDRPRVRATSDPVRPNVARVQLTFNITYPPF